MTRFVVSLAVLGLLTLPQVSAQQPATPPAQQPKPTPPAAEPAQSPAPAEQPTKPSSSAETLKSADALDLALEGHCPVSYHTDNRAIVGDAKYRADYQGYTYCLADADKQKKFQEDPEKYVPRIGGLCTVALGGPYGNRFSGDPKVFAVVEGKLYLCSSERAKRSFDQRPEHYISRAEELYKAPELKAMCPVSLQRGAPEQGQSEYRTVFRGRVYHFKGAEELEAFKKEPDRFVPQYLGYCAEGVAAGELRESDPLSAIAHNGRTYLFAGAEARDRCMSSEKTCISEADAKWPALKANAGKAPGKR